MIEITGVNLVQFVKTVYIMSSPVGMGFLHFTPEPLTDEEASNMINLTGPCAVSMDYVKGRGCKMNVRREGDKLFINDTWYDHTNQQLETLLDLCHVKVDAIGQKKHSMSCECADCKNSR